MATVATTEQRSLRRRPPGTREPAQADRADRHDPPHRRPLFAFPLYWIGHDVVQAAEGVEPARPGVLVAREPDARELREDPRPGLGRAQPVRDGSARAPRSPYLKNSIIASVGGTVLALVIGIFTAYGIARFRAGGKTLPFQILQLRMFPPIAIIIPLLFMWVQVGLWNTHQGLIILYGAVTFPFVVWLMRSFFQEVPREISEAAIVDGCTQWGAFFKAVLPQVKGGLAATALFVFILNWSDFLIAPRDDAGHMQHGSRVPAVAARRRVGERVRPAGRARLLLIIPPAVFGLLIQRYLVRGLTFGAIKR